MCQGLGQLRLVGSQQPVLFHLGQALRHVPPGDHAPPAGDPAPASHAPPGDPAPPGSHSPYLESHTRAEVEWLLRPGTRVTLNARKIRGCYLPLQVSLVSTSLLISM